VTIEWIKYIRNIDQQFVRYLCIVDLITMSVSLKQTHMHVSSAYVSMFVMRLWVCRRIQVQLKSLDECQLVSSIYWLMGICEVSDCSLVIRGGVWVWQVGRPPQAPLLRGPRASGLWVCQAIFSGKLEMLIHAPFKILLQGQIP